jgi:uncharacterized lipoprotein YddW (UPF0748 family)
MDSAAHARRPAGFSRRRFGALAAGTVAATAAATVPGGSAFAAPVTAGTAPAAGAPDPDAPLHQLRAFWLSSVVNIDWPSKTGLSVEQQQAELIGWFDLARRLNLNAVMLQVRPTADAFWASRFEPWSQYLTGTQGQDPGYDPLGFAVTEAHKRDLELHAWFNPYRVSMQTDPTKLVPWHPARVHPDWIFPFGPKLYYNPGIPEVRRFVEDAILDALRYDIDGVHFDDYFYPYPIAGQTVPDQDTFARYGAGFATIDDWRRDNINKLVSEMHHRIHAAKPWVKFGISPFGIWRNKTTDPLGSDTNGLESYSAISADTRRWVKEGWLDYINPQIYWNIGFTVADYAKLIPWWSDVVSGTDVQLWIGEATYKVGTTGAWLDPAELSGHLTFDQAYPQVSGNVYFSAVSVRTDTLGATSKLVADHYQHPALTPAMPRLDRRAPHSPDLRARRRSGGVELTLTAGPGPERTTSYAIFRYDGAAHHAPTPDDATHLVATVRATGRHQTWTDPTAEAGAAYTYVVLAASRVSVLSHPSNTVTIR